MEGPKTVPFIIRRATEDDLEQVMEVNLRSLPENYWYGFYRYILSEWGDLFFVAVVNDRVVGYIMNRVEDTHDRVLMGLENELEAPKRAGPLDVIRRVLSVPAKVGHVISIAVLQEYRRRGIGSALMSEALKTFKEKYDVDAVYLEVRVSNLPAINMYEKFGFVKARIIKGYYRDGEDAYVMVKRIKPLPKE
ncbi:MAG: GNAT family N-acetyltransferase [Acidilobus sp.]